MGTPACDILACDTSLSIYVLRSLGASVVLLFFFLIIRRPPSSPLFPYTPLFRSVSDRRVTLRELVLFTLLRQRLRAGAGQPISTQFQKLEEVSADAHVVVSLVALAAGRRQIGEHTSELQSLAYLVCRLLLEKKKK